MNFIPYVASGSVSVPCNEIPAAVVSSIAVFIFTSLLFFILGFLSSYFTLKFRASSTIATYEQPQRDGQTQDQSLYEAIPAVEHQDVELKENAAYSAVHLSDQQKLVMGENLAYIPVQQGDEDQVLELELSL